MSGNFIGTGAKRSKKPAGYFAALAALIIISVLLSYIFSSPLLNADFTGSGLYTLSADTCAAIDGLSSEVFIYTLYSPGNDNKTLSELLKKYAAQSENISLMNVDPTGRRSELDKIEDYEDVSYGSVVVCCEETGLYRVLNPADIYYEEGGMEYFAAENKLTSAIKYVSTGKEYLLYLLYEHREKSPAEFASFLSDIKKNNVEVKNYDFLGGEPLNSENSVLISVSPRQDYSAEELERLKEFISGGGTFIMLIDFAEYDAVSGTVVPVNAEIPNLTDFMRSFGFSLSDGIIYDSNPKNTGIRSSIIELNSKKDSILGAAAGKRAAVGECVPILTDSGNPNVRELLYTDDTAYSSGGAVSPYCVMAVSETGGGRFILASGSTLITMNEGLSNSELLKGIISSAGVETFGAADAKPLNPDAMVIDHGIVKIFLAVALIVVLPGAMLALGAEVIKRRKSGADR